MAVLRSGYFPVFFAPGLRSVSGGFFGRPLPGVFFIASKTSGEYSASCDIGLNPPLNILISIVRLGRFNFLAISEIVIPVIYPIIGSLADSLKNVNIKQQLLYKCKYKITNISKNVEKKSQILLIKCNFIFTIIYR